MRMQSQARSNVKKDMNVLATRSKSAQVLAYFRDPAVSLWRKLAGFGALAYVVSPVDAIPDWFPIVGWLDDIGVMALATWWFMREIKKHSDKTRSFPTIE
jgi:uncharacterized membrane protein YkvA (DUF1232 family)